MKLRAAALTVLVALGACSPQAHLDSPPASVAGRARHHEVTGAKALMAVRFFYGDAASVISGGWVAHYGQGASVILYVARTRDAAGATALLLAMKDRVAAGLTPFQDVAVTRLEGRPLLSMRGQGQEHFAFQEGRRVVWLSVDPPLVTDALEDVFGPGAAAWLDGMGR